MYVSCAAPRARPKNLLMLRLADYAKLLCANCLRISVDDVSPINAAGAKMTSVGSIVRAPRDNEGKRTGKASVATIEEGGKVDLIWEDAAPALTLGLTSFLVAPVIGTEGRDCGEVTIEASKLQELYPFESDGGGESDVEVWKDRGDTLLKSGDASAAVPFYERALQNSSKVEIGCSVLVQSRAGEIEVAEVDCMEDSTADITYVSSGNEESVELARIILAVSLRLSILQVRILLNLGRCLMQLAEFDSDPLSRSSAYKGSAWYAFSLILALATEDKEDEERRKYGYTALLLRSQVQASRGKWKSAIGDVNELLKENPSKEARKWHQTLQGLVTQHKKANKKLVKSMSRWIQTAMNSSEASSQPGAVSTERQSAIAKKQRDSSWIPIVVVVLASILVYQWTKGKE